jgi:hypothetical protein
MTQEQHQQQNQEQIEAVLAQISKASASIDQTDSDEVLRFYVGKALDELMKLQEIKPLTEENADHLLTQLAHDCYRVGYVAHEENDWSM